MARLVRRSISPISASSWPCCIFRSSSWPSCRSRTARRPHLSAARTSTIWYWKLFHPGQLTEYSDVGEFLGDYLGALQRSLLLALLTMIISTVLGLMAAQAFRRHFRGSGVVFYLWLLGIIVPASP
jgi:ABC-type spermidine/putrescine transport system permease subunit II